LRSIDMTIALTDGYTILYERLSAPNDSELWDKVKTQSIEWGTKGVWSDWESCRQFPKVYYPPTVVKYIKPYSNTPFGTEEPIDFSERGCSQ